MVAPRGTIVKIVEDLKPGDLVWETGVNGFGVRCQKRGKLYILKGASKTANAGFR